MILTGTVEYTVCIKHKVKQNDSSFQPGVMFSVHLQPYQLSLNCIHQAYEKSAES